MLGLIKHLTGVEQVYFGDSFDRSPPDTALGYLLVWVLEDTAQHAGHADIVRELAGGRTGSDTATSDTDWPT